MVTRKINKNTGTQVNSDKIGVLVNTDLTGVTCDIDITVIPVASTVNIYGNDYQLMRTSYNRVYWCTNDVAKVTVDEQEVKFLKFSLYASLQESGNEQFVWAVGESWDSLEDYTLYTLTYDSTLEEYTDPQPLNTDEVIADFLHMDDDHCYTGPMTFDFGTSGEVTLMMINRADNIRGVYEFEEDKSFVVSPAPLADMQARALVAGKGEAVTLKDVVFTVVEPQKIDGEYQFDVDNYIPVSATISDYGWTFIGFLPKNAETGDAMDINASGYQRDNGNYITGKIKSINYENIDCTVSYSVDGATWTDHQTSLTDYNNVIANIPRYMYLKFSQDVEITEE